MRFLPSFSAAAFTLVIGLLASTAPGRAQVEQKGAFDVYVRGLKAGVMAFSAIEDDTSYAATGYVESTGLLAAIVKVRYDARTRGAVRDGQFRPASYFEKTTGSRRNNESVLSYRGNRPQVKKYTPHREPRPWDAPPAGQAGTLDPMTVLYGALKDVPGDQVCALDVRMYDGRRASTVRLDNRAPDGDGFSCSGEYRRIKGWHPDDLSEKSRFPFRLTYAKVGEDLYRVTRVTMDTIAGRATLKRR